MHNLLRGTLSIILENTDINNFKLCFYNQLYIYIYILLKVYPMEYHDYQHINQICSDIIIYKYKYTYMYPRTLYTQKIYINKN